jgi:hypothetical protein
MSANTNVHHMFPPTSSIDHFTNLVDDLYLVAPPSCPASPHEPAMSDLTEGGQESDAHRGPIFLMPSQPATGLSTGHSEHHLPTLISATESTLDPSLISMTAVENVDRERLLRQALLVIQNDAKLSASEKSRQMQRLMMTQSHLGSQVGSRHVEHLEAPRRPSLYQNPYLSLSQEHLSKALHPLLDPSAHDNTIALEAISPIPAEIMAALPEETRHYQRPGVLGCPHYQRGCILYANCCRAWFPCRLCHDEAQ